MNVDRRSLLKYAALAPFVSAVTPIVRAAEEVADAKADYTLRIGTGLVELSPEHIAATSSESSRSTEIPYPRKPRFRFCG